jgi:hypothetical protein
MRTTVKQQAILMRQAREALGVRYNRDVYPALIPINEALQERLGGSAGVSHYKDNSWGVYCMLQGGFERFIYCRAEDLALTPEQFVEQVIGEVAA